MLAPPDAQGHASPSVPQAPSTPPSHVLNHQAPPLSVYRPSSPSHMDLDVPPSTPPPVLEHQVPPSDQHPPSSTSTMDLDVPQDDASPPVQDVRTIAVLCI